MSKTPQSSGDSLSRQIAFDRSGRVPCEDPTAIVLTKEQIRERLSALDEEGREAVTNYDFSELYKLLDEFADFEKRTFRDLESLEEIQDFTKSNVLERCILTQSFLSKYLTSSLASAIRTIVTDKDANVRLSPEQACWLGYVLGRRVGREWHIGQLAGTVDDQIRASEMNQKGRRKADPWIQFIEREQVTEKLSNGAYLSPKKLLTKLGAFEKQITAPDGSVAFEDFLSFEDPRCANLPKISKKSLTGKIKKSKETTLRVWEPR